LLKYSYVYFYFYFYGSQTFGETMIGRIGFACKYLDDNEVNVPELNTRGTTVAWLNRQTREAAEQRLWDIMVHNIESARRLIERVGEEDAHLRMVRLSSDLLPVYTESTWGYFWHLPDVQQYAERHFAEVGRLARDRDVRLSFHPGQFTVLASDNPDIVNRSIDEFEYHATMARWMGYGQTFQDIHIDVHISGKNGPAGIIDVLGRLSPEARNTIAFENDEITWGLDATLQLTEHVALILDIHHHFIKTGEYIQPNDDRVNRVIDSWRGLRPSIHYSVSREEYLPEYPRDQLVNLQELLDLGHKKSKLRAHSDYMWNNAVNDWALSHGTWSDIVVESKMKNLASRKLYEHWLSKQPLLESENV
jgi:UV DNA damage endonuclease